MTPSAQTGPGAPIARAVLAAAAAAMILALYIYTTSPSNDVKYLILAWAAPALACAAVALQGRRVALPLPVVLFGALALWLTACALVSDHPAYGLFHASRFLGLALLAMAAGLLIETRAQAERLFAVIVAALFIASAYGLLQYLGLDPMPWDQASMGDEAYTGLPATFGNANLAAHALAIGLVLAVYLACAAHTAALRIAYAFASCAFFVHLLYTGQRAAPLALIAAALFTAALALCARLRVSPKRGVLLVAAGLAAGAAAAALIVGAMGAAPGYLPLDGSLLLRYNAYFGAAEMVVDRPLFGFGPGNYAIENAAYWTPYEQRWFATRYHLNFHVHNDLLETAVDGGFAAAFLHLAVFIAAVSAAVVRALGTGGPERRFAIAMAAFFAAYFVDGLFGFNLRSPASGALFALVLGAAWAGDERVHRIAVGSQPMVRYGAVAALGVVALLVPFMGTADFRRAVLLKTGQDALAAGAPEKAEALLRRAAAVAPWGWAAPQQRGRALVALGRREEAAAAYAEALVRHPNDILSLLATAQTHLALYGDTLGTAAAAGHYRDSQASLARAKALCPGLSAVAGIEGRYALIEARELASKEGGTERARAAYERARDRFQAALPYAGDDRGAVHMFLFQSWLGLGDDDEAFAAIDKAVAADPHRADSWNFYYAYALQTQRIEAFRAALARAAVESVNALPPPAAAIAVARRDGPPVWLQAAQALAAYGAGMQGEARTPEQAQTLAWASDELAGLFRERPAFADRPMALFHLAAAYRTLDALPQAAALAEEAFAELPPAEKTQAALFLAMQHSEAGRHEEAQRMIEEAMRLAPREFDVWLASARVLKAAGQRGPALDRYRHILRQFSAIPAATRAVLDAEMDALQTPKQNQP